MFSRVGAAQPGGVAALPFGGVRRYHRRQKGTVERRQQPCRD
jgi:hypothetical protein